MTKFVTGSVVGRCSIIQHQRKRWKDCLPKLARSCQIFKEKRPVGKPLQGYVLGRAVHDSERLVLTSPSNLFEVGGCSFTHSLDCQRRH